MFKITKNNVTFKISELQILCNAFYNSYCYEKNKGHLYDADMYYKVYEVLDERVKHDKQKESQGDISSTASEK